MPTNSASAARPKLKPGVVASLTPRTIEPQRAEGHRSASVFDGPGVSFGFVYHDRDELAAFSIAATIFAFAMAGP